MPRRVWIAALAVVAAAALATQLSPTASPELLTDPDSATARLTAAVEREFGGEPIVVVVEGDLREVLGPERLLELLELEGRLAQVDGVELAIGPATFINQTVIQIESAIEQQLGAVGEEAQAAADAARRQALDGGASARVAEQAGEDARQAALGAKVQEYRDILIRLGAIGAPSLVNRAFIAELVYGPGTEPKRRFRWLFADNTHAVVLIRPRPGLEGAEMLALGRELRQVIDANPVKGTQTTVAGAPLAVAGLDRELRRDLLRLAPIALGAMLLLLVAVLRRRRGRLLSLGLALGSVALVAGLSLPLGLGLTPATVAALPVVLGLALDFGIQLQARYWTEREAGRPPDGAAAAAARGVGPTLLLAGAAMALAFLTLVLSGVPLLDRLGITLALGVTCALALVLTAGPPLLARFDRGAARPLRLRVPRRLTRVAVRPVAVGLVLGLAVAGIAVSGDSKLGTDLTELGPADGAELRALDAVQEQLGTSGQLRVAVQADDVATPAVVEWMAGVHAGVLELDAGFDPGPSLPDLLTDAGARSVPDQAGIDAVLGQLPAYLRDAVVGEDRRLSEMTYTVPLTGAVEREALVRDVRELLEDPPPGVEAAPAGLAGQATQSTRALEAVRPGLLLVAALVAGLVLLGAWRGDVKRVLIVLAPALMAAGLTALVLVALDVRLSPLSAGLEPLVLAVGLEFGMLLDMRYRQSRAGGLSPAAARDEALRHIAGPVALSAATVAAGFGVLVASGLPLLNQLGWLVALELALCVTLAILLVPAASAAVDGRSLRPPSAHERPKVLQ